MYRVVLMLAFCAAVSCRICQNTTCPRFYNAECRDDHCTDATCSPHFFFRGSNVSDRCQVETCAEKKCSEFRRCVEEVITLPCPVGRTTCRQFLQSQCVLVETNRPMSCSDIQCDLGEVCRFRARRNRFPIVRCVSLEKQTSCTNIHCSNGRTCVEDRSKIQCIESPGTAEPITTTMTAEVSETTPPASQGSGTTDLPGSSIGGDLCNGTVCSGGERCLTIPSSNYTGCIPVHVNVSCAELNCPSEAPICSLATFPSFNNCTVASCISQDKLLEYTESRCRYGSSCDDQEARNRCGMEALTCVNLFQDGTSVCTDCTSFNCHNNEKNKCSPRYKCFNISNTRASDDLDTDSLCIPIRVNIQTDVSCGDQQGLGCTQGSMCTEYKIGDYLVGSYCDRGQLQQLPCTERTCLAEREVCSENSFESVQLHSLCTHEDAVLEVFTQLQQESCMSANNSDDDDDDMTT